MDSVKEIVIISGKGGTGKTSITASFAKLAGNSAIIADCDVDASDMHLLLDPENLYTEEFFSGKTASINNDKCNQCDRCIKACRFDAISKSNGNYSIKEIDCEGCGYCFQVCPSDAIVMKQNNTGKFFIGQTRMHNNLVHARLNIGAENSGKLVSKIRQESKTVAKKNETRYILVDGSPGIGCPVIASITGADHVVLVTEPTISGFHDLQRIVELVKQFKLSASCIINKADINTTVCNQIKEFLKNQQIELLAEVTYDEVFSEAMTNGKTIIEYDNGEISKQLKKSWEKITNMLQLNER